MARPKRLSEQDRRDLIVRQGELTALAQHPGFDVLRATVDDKAAKLERVVLAKTLYNDKEISVNEIHYFRGCIHGMRWATAVPGEAESSLELFLRRQGADVR